MFRQSPFRSLVLLVTLASLALYASFGGFFAREIVVEIAILAILAISLDMAAGFGGMISLMHGALMGLAAYVYGVLTVKFGIPALPSALLGILGAGLVGALIAAITSKTTGTFFIMATLAFGQLAFTIIFKTHWLGGSDGMSGLPRFDLSWLGIDLNKSLPFALYSLVLLTFVYLVAAWVMRSGFGRSLTAIRVNEARIRALGLSVWRHKSQAFTISSLLAGLGGVLAGQHAQFISPEFLFWTHSGEILIVVILGGLGTLIGPLVGATAFILFKHWVNDFTDYWHIFVGLFLIAAVLGGGRGLVGQAEVWLERWKSRLKKNA